MRPYVEKEKPGMTIVDIARLSGCSVGTVSRVLNNHPDVSDETRKKVLSVVMEYNFQPNTNAKHLKQQAASNIAILVKGTKNMLFADILEQIQLILLDNGKLASVNYLDEDANEVLFALQLCRERKPQGILFLGGDLDFFKDYFTDISVPCLLLTNSAQELGFENLSSLTTDDTVAAESAIEYLLSQGHKNIGVLGGNWSFSQISYRRISGCKLSFSRHDTPFIVDRQYEPCRFSMADAYNAADRLLNRNPDLTAIFALSDVIAIGAIRAIKDRGLRVPEDISVIGYDGIASANFSVPRLATIQQDTRKLAERGTDILLRNIERSPRPIHEVVPFRLIYGESVIPPAK